jgi:hypothetical protein
MTKNVAAYMRYYNLERLQTKHGDQSPINYEALLRKCQVIFDQNTLFWWIIKTQLIPSLDRHLF